MKFDTIISNPPYQRPSKAINSQQDYWPVFVKKSLELVKENGYICNIHPSRWRKPEHKLWSIRSKILYLEIHSKEEGQKAFGAITRYDWYVLKNDNKKRKAIVIDEDKKKHCMYLSRYPFLPNKNFSMVFALIGENDIEHIEHSRSLYGSDKKTVYSSSKYDHRKLNGNNKYPIIHALNRKGVKLLYAKQDIGHFGVPKVICSLGRYPYPINDYKGKYGMSQNNFGILINSKEEGDDIIKAINSEKFQIILSSTTWGNFQIEWRIFKYFKKNWWREFV